MCHPLPQCATHCRARSVKSRLSSGPAASVRTTKTRCKFTCQTSTTSSSSQSRCVCVCAHACACVAMCSKSPVQEEKHVQCLRTLCRVQTAGTCAKPCDFTCTFALPARVASPALLHYLRAWLHLRAR